MTEERSKRTPARPLSDDEHEKLDAYLDEYRDYITRVSPLLRTSLRSFSVELILENVGRGPAHDIDVSVYAPSGLSLATAP